MAQLQLQMAQKLNEMVKDVGKYSDELARKHKVVKESESNTVEAIQVFVLFKWYPFVLLIFLLAIRSWIKPMWPYSDQKRHISNEEVNWQNYAKTDLHRTRIWNELTSSFAKRPKSTET